MLCIYNHINILLRFPPRYLIGHHPRKMPLLTKANPLAAVIKEINQIWLKVIKVCGLVCLK